MTDIGTNACDHPRVREGFEWWLSFFARADWNPRKSSIETRGWAQPKAKAPPSPADCSHSFEGCSCASDGFAGPFEDGSTSAECRPGSFEDRPAPDEDRPG